MKMYGEPKMNKTMPNLTEKSEREEAYSETPLGAICTTLDGLIAKGGASAEELSALKESAEAVKADVEGEDASPGDGFNDSTDRAEPGGKDVMIAIGFKRKKRD